MPTGDAGHNVVIFQLEVRFRDIDAMGHVNNALFMTYFEEGRKAFLREVFDITEPSRYPFILARIECDYLRPVSIDDGISVRVWVTGIGTKSFTFVYELFDPRRAGALYAKGSSVMVFYDYDAGRTTPMPDDFRRVLLAYSDDAGG